MKSFSSHVVLACSYFLFSTSEVLAQFVFNHSEITEIHSSSKPFYGCGFSIVPKLGNLDVLK